MDPLEILPVELVEQILAHVTYRDLVCLREVNENWRCFLSDDNKIWRPQVMVSDLTLQHKWACRHYWLIDMQEELESADYSLNQGIEVNKCARPSIIQHAEDMITDSDKADSDGADHEVDYVIADSGKTDKRMAPQAWPWRAIATYRTALHFNWTGGHCKVLTMAAEWTADGIHEFQFGGLDTLDGLIMGTLSLGKGRSAPRWLDEDSLQHDALQEPQSMLYPGMPEGNFVKADESLNCGNILHRFDGNQWSTLFPKPVQALFNVDLPTAWVVNECRDDPSPWEVRGEPCGGIQTPPLVYVRHSTALSPRLIFGNIVLEPLDNSQVKQLELVDLSEPVTRFEPVPLYSMFDKIVLTDSWIFVISLYHINIWAFPNAENQDDAQVNEMDLREDMDEDMDNDGYPGNVQGNHVRTPCVRLAHLRSFWMRCHTFFKLDRPGLAEPVDFEDSRGHLLDGLSVQFTRQTLLEGDADEANLLFGPSADKGGTPNGLVVRDMFVWWESNGRVFLIPSIRYTLEAAALLPEEEREDFIFRHAIFLWAGTEIKVLAYGPRLAIMTPERIYIIDEQAIPESLRDRPESPCVMVECSCSICQRSRRFKPVLRLRPLVLDRLIRDNWEQTTYFMHDTAIYEHFTITDLQLDLWRYPHPYPETDTELFAQLSSCTSRNKRRLPAVPSEEGLHHFMFRKYVFCPSAMSGVAGAWECKFPIPNRLITNIDGTRVGVGGYNWTDIVPFSWP